MKTTLTLNSIQCDSCKRNHTTRHGESHELVLQDARLLGWKVSRDAKRHYCKSCYGKGIL